MMQSDMARISSDGVFFTLQGEGPLSGVPSVFVRLDTCNLRCKWGDTWCDAHYTSWTPGNERVALDDLRFNVRHSLFQNNCSHIVITGGEPCLQARAVGAITTVARLVKAHTTIETNGTIFLAGNEIDLVCISPKLSSSIPLGTKYARMHSKARWNPETIKQWVAYNQYYFKFVIDSEDDIFEVKECLREVGIPLPDPQHVVFMPQGINRDELWEKGRWLAEKCKVLGVRFSPRLQIDLYGNKPGT